MERFRYCFPHCVTVLAASILLASCTPAAPQGQNTAESDGFSSTQQSSEEPVRSYPVEAGVIRSPESCGVGEIEDFPVAGVVKSMNGQEMGEAPSEVLTQTTKRWAPLDNTPVAQTGSFPERMHLIGMRDDGVGLGNRQFLQPPATPAVSASGLVSTEGFAPFSTVTFLSEQLPHKAQAAPIAGSFAGGKAVWLEQLVTGQQNATDFPWRIMGADAEPDAPVLELASSFALSNSESSPSPTPWRAPVANGQQVAFEYAATVSEQHGWESHIGIVDFAEPGVLKYDKPGRLPVSIDGHIAWVEDTTSFGLDAENDLFTIRWLEDVFPPLVLETGGFAKLQWLEGNADYLVMAFQDTCAGLTWIARYDRHLDRISSWKVTQQDRIAASLNGNVLVWGNGSGGRGPQMYRWDLSTDEATYLGDNEGYSVPFSAAQSYSVVPSFGSQSGAPLVSWAWYATR